MTDGPSRDVDATRPADEVSLSIDGIELSVPKGTLIIRAAEQLGIQVPRFCDHPLLDPIGACRQCMVEVEGQRKPMTACTTTCTDGMVVQTQLTSMVAGKAQAGTLEMLLINHPLDCPVCDKGGECPLQNQAMSNGYAESRFLDRKRTFPKPIPISSQILLDRERCVLCARCTRFSQQIAGDPFIDLFERGALEQVAIYEDEPFESYFSGNTVQICPVGALTGTAYRFRARPFDLVSTPSVCEHCSSGCQQRTDWRRGRVLRRLAGSDPDVNEEWNCDKGRWAFAYATAADRLTTPAVRDPEGYLVETSWTEALDAAADALRPAAGRVGVLTGGRLTVEDAYAYAKFARRVCRSNDIDFRARPHSREEEEFLAGRVAGRYLEVTYADLESAPTVLLVGFEPEEESPIVFLRLRKAVRTGQTKVYSVASWTTAGLTKLAGILIRTIPGAEPDLLGAIAGGGAGRGEDVAAAAAGLSRPGAVILVGERVASLAGTLSAVVRLAEQTGARLAWVPRRAGDRGAVEAGALPNLLPGGRRIDDPGAHAEVSGVWGGEIPTVVGRNTTEILEAARGGELDVLIVGGVDIADLPDPDLAEAALAAAPFVISLELRTSFVTERADVVLPVAPTVEKGGTFLNWEGRVRPFSATFEQTGALPDGRVLHALAGQLDVDLGLPHADAARDELRRIGAAPASARTIDDQGATVPVPDAGQAILASWHHLLDDGALQDGEPFLAGTRRLPRALISAGTAAEIGVQAGGPLTVSTQRGAVTLPSGIADLPDRVVWLPTRSPGCHVRRDLGVDAGALVALSAGGQS
ncbi:MAG TPA: NADH-quinone oxidoreductase subunit G [Mycobacteriales bacterium]|nr:NADH-quinone oxidoreductase subunit G [Mycobacteriales bacterium]